MDLLPRWLLVSLALCLLTGTAVRGETVENGFRVFGEDDPFEKITSQGQWLMVLTHKKAGVKEECAAAEEVVKEAAASLSRVDLPFQLTKIDCFDFPDPCLDYGAKKRYPFIALNFPKSIRKGVQFKSNRGDDASVVSTAEELEEWIQDQIYEKIQRIPTIDDFHRMTASGQWLVMLHAPFEESKHSRDSLSMWRGLARWAARNKTLSVGSFLCNRDSFEFCNKFVNMSQPRELPAIYLFDGLYADGYSGLWGQEDVLKWWRQTVANREDKGEDDDHDDDGGLRDEL